MTRPVGVDELPWLSQQFVCVSPKIVTLGLNQIGRYPLIPLGGGATLVT